ncbi:MULTISPECIES: cupredoxin domain-containing protein [unclassified Hyphomicrobium]|uniref:cupredoxin domain-containing protein n=1 Tax=unclassified Hyphomicrobium TaxID=2619925 RepID=UPI000213ED00|nr:MULTISPECIES: cupredoxin domain-containing protein [unclassified Hyphomicrobium]CCB64104.1 conserved exported protein of unknown function [Hyphomicrobium sp. MC1]
MITPRQVALTLAAAAIGFAGAAALAATGTKRAFTIAAIEPKGGTLVSKEPFPTTPLPEGGGYELKQPNSDGRWEVSAYLWSTPQIHVKAGDEVTLSFVGLNGASHPTTIEGYDKSFTLKRGEVQNVSFVADKPGVYRIICSKHQPTMVSELIVDENS